MACCGTNFVLCALSCDGMATAMHWVARAWPLDTQAPKLARSWPPDTLTSCTHAPKAWWASSGQASPADACVLLLAHAAAGRGCCVLVLAVGACRCWLRWCVLVVVTLVCPATAGASSHRERERESARAREREREREFFLFLFWVGTTCK